MSVATTTTLGPSPLDTSGSIAAIAGSAIALLLLIAALTGWIRRRIGERRFPDVKIDIGKMGFHDEFDDSRRVTARWFWFDIRFTCRHRLHGGSFVLEFRAQMDRPLGNLDMGETPFTRPKRTRPVEVPAETFPRPLNLEGRTAGEGIFVACIDEPYLSLMAPGSMPHILVEDLVSEHAIAIPALVAARSFVRRNWIDLKLDEQGFWSIFLPDGSMSTRRTWRHPIQGPQYR